LFRTRVKICGITRVEDMRAAVAAGADAIGLVFYPPSPRAVTAEQAADIVAQTPAFVTTVGLFVDPTVEQVKGVLEQVHLDMLQFHGDEEEAFCCSFQRPFIKAIRMREGTDLVTEMKRWQRARGILVDAFVEGVPGGTGVAFDWSLLPQASVVPLILAGGLTPDNITRAIEQARPFAVDVSGGVEQKDASGKSLGGIKSADAIEQFMRGVASVRAS
jgi:phosphoribosylanthranilate isomerase